MDLFTFYDLLNILHGSRSGFILYIKSPNKVWETLMPSEFLSFRPTTIGVRRKQHLDLKLDFGDDPTWQCDFLLRFSSRNIGETDLILLLLNWLVIIEHLLSWLTRRLLTLRSLCMIYKRR